MENYNLMINKIQKAIKNATNSKFYSFKFANSKNPKSITEFKKYPFTKAEDLFENPNSFLSQSQSLAEKVVTAESSGTSSMMKRIFFTKKELESTIDFFKEGLSPIIKKGDTALIMMPSIRDNSLGDLIGKSIIKLDAKPVILGFLKDFKETFNLIKKADNIIGTPIQVLAMARYFKHIGEPTFKLNGILLSADFANEEIFSEISASFNCPVINHYGTTEICYGGAVECLHKSGMRLRNKDIFFEIIDKDTLLPKRNGEYGEIVVTTLTRNLMPLIRYRTGDFGRLINASCECSENDLRLDNIKGRISELFLKDKSPSIYYFDNKIFSLPHIIDYKINFRENNFYITIYSFKKFNIEKIKQEFKSENVLFGFEINLIVTDIWPNLFPAKRKIERH